MSRVAISKKVYMSLFSLYSHAIPPSHDGVHDFLIPPEAWLA